MISTQNVSLSFGGRRLFEDVNVKFVPGNCYGLIGANGAGKSTLLKILSGELAPSSGSVALSPPNQRISVLRQDHFAFDDENVLMTVIMGQKELVALMKEREALYSKEELTDEDGERASDLEEEFGAKGGWEAEANAAKLLAGLGIPTEQHAKKMKELPDGAKVKVLLAQALFGDPEILLLDEPTNHLDTDAIRWLEDFLLAFEKTTIVVSHDRHFLNVVCTHIVDVDYGKVKIFTGNYDFWYESSQLALRLREEKNRRDTEKREELKQFIARFSANKSKSRQATSRRKLLEKLTPDDIEPSSRRYPFVGFKPAREVGDQILRVENLRKDLEGKPLFDGVSFEIHKGDKVAFVSDNDAVVTALFDVLAGETQPDGGQFKWGVTTSQTYFPKDNARYFQNNDLSLVDWLRQFSDEKSETFLRGFLGRMLFSGEESLKKVKVLSGGEKVRCMLSKMMLSSANVLILDGPTNHLDLESITAVNNGLVRFSEIVLFSSHDQQFNETVATRVIEIVPGGKAIDWEVPYAEYLEKKLADKKRKS
jgi:ATPase subunit of ABC transporter with duplicated ATPase domains